MEEHTIPKLAFNKRSNMLLRLSTFLVLLSTTYSQQPATINVDRNWKIPETTKVGSLVKTAEVQGENNETVTFSLSLEDPFNPNQENPFWIHPHNVNRFVFDSYHRETNKIHFKGFVYLNKSLEGKVSAVCGT